MNDIMSLDTKIEDCESIPRSPEWYAKEPFDPSIVAFRDNDGREHRYMNSPLDETYADEPGDSYRSGTLPPEEREVRDTFLAAVTFRNRVSWFEFWWSQFFKPTESYRVSLEWFQKLHTLCAKSREHRAAFCRLSKSEKLVFGLRFELRRIVEMCDQGKF